MIFAVSNHSYFERIEESTFGKLLKADSSSYSFLGMTNQHCSSVLKQLIIVSKSGIVCILTLLFLLLASQCVWSAQQQKDTVNPKVVRHELKQILSQPEYNRVYAETKIPKWWINFLRKAVDAIGRIFGWLFKSISLQSESAGRLTSFIFACLVVLAFLALLFLIVRKISGNIKTIADDKPDKDIEHYELPSARPLISEAARLADAGDWRGAFRCVYLASISHLDEIGALRFEKSRTNWEYLRELDKSGRLSLKDQLQPLTSDFDRKFYGRENCNREDYARALIVYQSIVKEAAA